MDKYCPNCGEKYQWYEAECPACHVALEERPTDEGQAPLPDARLVVVLQTTDAALLPLAEIALDQAGIEYAIRDAGISSLIVGFRSTASIGETRAPLEVVVRAEDEARARELLDDLGAANATVTPPARREAAAAPAVAPDGSPGSVNLIDAETGGSIGRISEEQFQTLTRSLENESLDDEDYYIDEPTLSVLQDAQVDATVIELLRRALGARDGMDIRWMRR